MGDMTFIIRTVSIIAIIKLIFSIMRVSIMTVSKMTVSIMTLIIKNYIILPIIIVMLCVNYIKNYQADCHVNSRYNF